MADNHIDNNINNHINNNIIDVNDNNYDDYDDDIILNKMQKKAIKWCNKKSKIYSKSAYLNSLCKFINIGYNETDLQKILEYIKSVDVIVHFGSHYEKKNPESETNHAKWIISDDRIRNSFEIISKGNEYNKTRIIWEKNLFGSIYTDDCEPISRVKYGCLNLLNDPNGCKTARCYGLSYFILKPEVKKRTTFVICDKKKQLHICSFEHFAQLFMYMTNETIHSLHSLINNKNTKINYTYKCIESHIHGNIYINRDVEEIRLHASDASSEIKNALDAMKIKYSVFN
jgi:hypothetical protein